MFLLTMFFPNHLYYWPYILVISMVFKKDLTVRFNRNWTLIWSDKTSKTEGKSIQNWKWDLFVVFWLLQFLKPWYSLMDLWSLWPSIHAKCKPRMVLNFHLFMKRPVGPNGFVVFLSLIRVCLLLLLPLFFFFFTDYDLWGKRNSFSFLVRIKY